MDNITQKFDSLADLLPEAAVLAALIIGLVELVHWAARQSNRSDKLRSLLGAIILGAIPIVTGLVGGPVAVGATIGTGYAILFGLAVATLAFFLWLLVRAKVMALLISLLQKLTKKAE